jgi:hypothetical protein
MSTSLYGSGLSPEFLPQQQGDRFITVEGADLRAKIENATRMGRGLSPQTRFWVAYSFDVRPGIAVDPTGNTFQGSMNDYDGITVFRGKSDGVSVETRNLGIFLMYEPDGQSIARLEIYNLDKKREYSTYPVYWLGRGGNEESLNLLKQIATSTARTRKLNERGVLAIAMHDDPRVAGILKSFVSSQMELELRKTAVYWLGHSGTETAFLADIVRSEQGNEGLRETAAFAIGITGDASALSTLIELYRTVPRGELRRKLIHSISMNDNQEPAIDFLIRVAKTDPDMEARKQAMFWLGHKAGERALGVLKDAVEAPDGDTEVQKQAVFVLSRRPKDEAVPLLIKVARTHPKLEVRKDAIFWLGRTGDERALAFFEEILSK